jgi:hypothetical protein
MIARISRFVHLILIVREAIDISEALDSWWLGYDRQNYRFEKFLWNFRQSVLGRWCPEGLRRTQWWKWTSPWIPMAFLNLVSFNSHHYPLVILMVILPFHYIFNSFLLAFFGICWFLEILSNFLICNVTLSTISDFQYKFILTQWKSESKWQKSKNRWTWSLSQSTSIAQKEIKLIINN